MHRRALLKSAAAVSLVPALARRAAAAAPPAFPWTKNTRTIRGAKMALVETGEGRPVVMLHGNPTSSYLWRGIIPHLESGHRVIAPDLIGMGDSGKPEIGYTYDDHAAYLHGLLDALDLEDAVFVLHDWGSALGFDWAMRNEDRVAAIAYAEALVPPTLPFPSYEAMGPFGEMFRMLRGPEGAVAVLEQNHFVEVILRDLGVAERLPEDVMAAYRAPFPTPESRRPTLQWPREIPIGGEPARTHDLAIAVGEWLQQTPIPKLALYADPGALMPKAAVDWQLQHFPNISAVNLGTGGHFLQEDQPDAFGRALRSWIETL